MSVRKVVGLYYFEKPTVNAENYRHLLKNYFHTMLRSLPLGPLFQKDGPVPHFSYHFRASFDETLPDLWI